MGKPYITSKFDEDTNEYDKETGSSTGTNASDDKGFKDNVLSYLSSVKDGSFLAGGLKKLNLSLKALLEKGLGLLSLANVKSSLLSKLDNTPFSLKSAGLGGLVKLLTISEKIFGNLVQQIAGEVLSRIFIPDPVYLASLIAFDVAGADLEINGNYIRKLILRRDITIALKWWDKTWGISYTGLKSDRFTSDGVIAAKAGSYKNLEYILGEFKKSHSTLIDALRTLPVVTETNIDKMNQSEKDLYKKRNNLANYSEEVYAMMVYLLKELIVSSYSNFTADELKNLLNKTGIQPSVFGLTDTRFGGKFAIVLSDINKCAPFFKMNAFNEIGEFSNIRSSRYRRQYIKEHGHPPSESRSSSLFKYINPRNRNIKRLYLVLVSKDYDSVMYNPLFAERLGYKIANVFLKSLRGVDLIPNSLFESQEALWSSAYDYTRNIEDYLFNPAKVSDLKFVDTDIIKMPAEINNATTVTNSYNTNENIRNQQSANKINVYNNSIGPTLVIDSIKNDIITYNNLPFVESPIYDINGNRVLRDGLGGFILADDNGNPVLDGGGNTIPVSSDNVPNTPKEYRNSKEALPSNFDDYIKKVVDQYMSLNIEDIVRSVLLKLKNGTITVSSSDAIERLAFVTYKESGGLFYNEINTDQVLAEIINKIQNGTYTPTILETSVLSDLITENVVELKDNDLYVPVFNSDTSATGSIVGSPLNKSKLAISILQNNISKVISGELDPASMPNISTINNEAAVLDSKGIISKLGTINTEVPLSSSISIPPAVYSALSSPSISVSPVKGDEYIMIERNGEFSEAIYLTLVEINNRLAVLKKNGIETVTYTDLLSGTSFEYILLDYKSKLASGKVIPISLPESRVVLRSSIEEVLDNVQNDIITVDDIPSFIILNAASIEKTEGKYDLSQIMSILEEMGIDINGYDVMEYYRELDKKINENKDEDFYEFDVNNPPSSVLRSIEEEYNIRLNFKSRYYIWVNNIEI